MRRILACLIILLLAVGALSAAADSREIRVGIAWVGDVTNSVRDKKIKPYVSCVKKAGGLPVYLPGVDDAAGARRALQDVDCVVFIGGEDIDPGYYGETPDPKLEDVNAPRDASDYWLCRAAIEDGVPVLGICRGCQLINVVMGGTLYQDIPSQLKSDAHRDPRKKKYLWHDIDVPDPSSRLAEALDGAGTYNVNSWHHQGVKALGRGLVATATSADGMIEAVESADEGRFLLGVQFHPERMVEKGQKAYLALFESLIAAARG